MTVEPDDTGGLGYISKAGELAVTLELGPPVTAQLPLGQLSLGSDPRASSSTSTSGAAGADPEPSAGTAPARKAKRRDRPSRKDKDKDKGKDRGARAAVSLELEIHQDPSGLHSRSGETGTVLWRCSRALAENTLAALVFDPPGWLDWAAVAVLELGSGVGLLAAALGAVAREWTATDYLHENLRLVRRNCTQNASVRTEIARLAGRPHPHPDEPHPPAGHGWDDEDDAKGKKGRRRDRAEKHGGSEAVPMPIMAQLDWTTVSEQRAAGRASVPQADLVLAVDCLYNEHLVRPLVDTLATACKAGAVAYVVVELRSSDVVSAVVFPLLPPPKSAERAECQVVHMLDCASRELYVCTHT